MNIHVNKTYGSNKCSLVGGLWSLENTSGELDI